MSRVLYLVVLAVGLLSQQLRLLELRLELVVALLVLQRAVLHHLARALNNGSLSLFSPYTQYHLILYYCPPSALAFFG